MEKPSRFRFRAWLPKQNRMWGPETGSEHRPLEEFWHDPTDMTLMQSTGLVDKNGREIFEGDVVLDIDYGTKELVEWIDAGFAPFVDAEDTLGLPPSKCRVVGNIHENPGLVRAPHS